MAWTPGPNTSELCSSGQCTAATLTFMNFLSHFIGFSYDNNFKFVTTDDGSDNFDFVIVGGGSAGCVVANRLSENPNWKILLLERGGEEPIIADIPGLDSFSGKEIDYAYTTQPQKNSCGSKSCKYPRGKVLGGSSVLFGMHMTRGNRWDYDNWANMGNPGWSWSEVLPYFKKSEDLRVPDVLRRNPFFHGTGGYHTVEGASFFDTNAKTIMKAWKELGLKELDYNAGDNLGTSRMQYATIKGARQSSNGAYLRPIRGKRPNLTIRTNSWVTRVIIDPKSKVARGVEYKTSGSNKTKSAYADKEVILSAGSIDSPKILMLSGVGPADNLRDSKIDVIQELPVGKNFQNHFKIVPFSVSVPKKFRPANFSLEKVRNDVIYWLNTHDGPLSINPFMDNVAFLQTSHEKVPKLPDIQIHYIKYVHDKSTKSDRLLLPYYDGFRIGSINVAPKSRGQIKLDPADPVNRQPLIYPNYFSHPDDIKVLAEGANLTKRVLDTKAFKTAGFVASKVPGPLCDHLEFATFQYYECLMKNYTGTTNHPVSSCKMGPKNDPQAVVDARLKVRGIAKLRVIDASIMPLIPRGNTYWPTIMIGEKGSDMIKQDWSSYKSLFK